MTQPAAAASGAVDAQCQFGLTELAECEPELQDLPAYLRACADAIEGADSLQRLTILMAAVQQLKSAITPAGAVAVQEGCSVAAVGRAAGMTRQAAHQRWAAPVDQDAGDDQPLLAAADLRRDARPVVARLKVEDVTVRLPGLPGRLRLQVERRSRPTPPS